MQAIENCKLEIFNLKLSPSLAVVEVNTHPAALSFRRLRPQGTLLIRAIGLN
jgi:hypothetical protein